MKLGQWFCSLLGIKKRSFYVGTLYFTITKESPYYRSGGDILNNVHFEFLGFYFASRLIKRKTKSGFRKDQKLIKVFESTCGVKVGNYKVNDSSENTYDDWTLSDAVVTPISKRLVGTLDDCYWMLEKSVVACDEFPSAGYSIKDNTWIGWSHRAKAAFKKGDRLFDEKYKPVDSDYTKEEWTKYSIAYQKSLNSAIDELDRKWIIEDGIAHVIPFKQRGPKIIETNQEAKQAAINFSKYVS
jgi:uncharacterized protein YneF (UPF0154 family)